MEKRFEIKYEVYSRDFSKVYSSFIKNLKIFREHKSRKVYSLYFDDKNLNSLFDNITGISEREKYRLRWYQSFENIKISKFEIKKKLNKLTSKTSINLKSEIKEQDIEYLFNKKSIFSKYFSKKSFNQIFIKKINKILKPILITNYEREYFKYDNNLRITFDSSIKYKLFNTKFGNWVKDDKCVIEIKCKENYINNYKKILKNIPLVTKRNSKYVKGMSVFNRTNYY